MRLLIFKHKKDFYKFDLQDEDRNLSFDVELGQTVNISCLFENGFPKPDFNWTDEAGNEIASFPVGR